jgi:tyrosinase
MVNQALKYTDESTKTKYLEACDRFRLPYWDPCLPRQLGEDHSNDLSSSSTLPYEFGIPKIVSKPKVFVKKQESSSELSEVDNPLYQYKFPENFRYPNNTDLFWQHPSKNALIEDSSLEGTYHTVRAPDENGLQDDKYINTYMHHHIQSDIGSSMYKVLTAHQKWAVFSNDVYDEDEAQNSKDGKSYIDHTLEGFHDNVHVFLGQGKLGTGQKEKGSGHIGDPNYAAFDPLFWLHHW